MDFAPDEPGGSSLARSFDDCHKGQAVQCLCRCLRCCYRERWWRHVGQSVEPQRRWLLAALEGPYLSRARALRDWRDKMLASGSADMTNPVTWDMDNQYKLTKVVGAAKGGINFSINDLTAISDTRFATAADNIKIWSIGTTPPLRRAALCVVQRLAMYFLLHASS